MLFYGALRSLGVDVDVRHPDDDLSGYKVVVAPAIQLVGPERAANLARAAERARLVVGPRTGYRTPTGRVHEDGQPGPLRHTLGCSLLNFDALRPGLTVHAGGHRVETWAESYRQTGGSAETIYDDGPLAGQPAVVLHGNARTIGAWSPTLVAEVLIRALTEAGVPVTPVPDGVRIARRGDLVVRMNFNETPLTLPDGAALGPVSFDVRTR
jgi:beta-galactosidase